MPGIVEHGLGTVIGFVTKPVGMAVTGIVIAGVVAGGVTVKNWWDNVQLMDDTIAEQTGTIGGLRADLRTSEANAADARTEFGRREDDLERQLSISRQEASDQRLRVRRLAARIEELQHEETGPIAPVLVHALDSVRDDLRGFTPA